MRRGVSERAPISLALQRKSFNSVIVRIQICERFQEKNDKKRNEEHEYYAPYVSESFAIEVPQIVQSLVVAIASRSCEAFGWFQTSWLGVNKETTIQRVVIMCFPTGLPVHDTIVSVAGSFPFNVGHTGRIRTFKACGIRSWTGITIVYFSTSRGVVLAFSASLTLGGSSKIAIKLPLFTNWARNRRGIVFPISRGAKYTRCTRMIWLKLSSYTINAAVRRTRYNSAIFPRDAWDALPLSIWSDSRWPFPRDTYWKLIERKIVLLEKALHKVNYLYKWVHAMHTLLLCEACS